MTAGRAAGLLRSRLKYAFVDIDGTIADASGALPGAVEAFSRLRQSVKSLRLVTNQSQETVSTTIGRLRQNGFDLEDQEFFGTLAAVRRLIDVQNLRPLFLLKDEALGDFTDIPRQDPNAVVVGTAPQHLHYERLGEAMRVLMKQDSQLIACNKGRFYRGVDGEMHMMAGPFVSALEFATGKKAITVGKPSPSFFHEAALDAAAAAGAPGDLAFNECVMIGDDAKDDIQGAMDAGMNAILVRTGKYRAGDENMLQKSPLAVVDDFPTALEVMRQQGFLQE